MTNRVVGFVENATPFLDVVSAEADDERLVGFVSELQRAPTMPLATASQDVMPPKTLTNTLFTCSSPRMILSPQPSLPADAPPPMSREIGGLDTAVVLPRVGDDVERGHHQAAPLPMTPTSPSSLT